jgi:hypothetical protein
MSFPSGLEPYGFTVRRPACLLVYADLKKLVDGASRLANRKVIAYFQSHDVLALLHVSHGSKPPGRIEPPRKP